MPRTGDADFREELLAAHANELADGLGNLVNRTIGLVGRFRPKGVATRQTRVRDADALQVVIEAVPDEIDEALARFDFRAATAAIWRVVEEANRLVARTRPWELARAEGSGDGDAAAALDEVLGVLLVACRSVAFELEPFLPAASGRISRALSARDPQLGQRLFTKASVRT